MSNSKKIRPKTVSRESSQENLKMAIVLEELAPHIFLVVPVSRTAACVRKELQIVWNTNESYGKFRSQQVWKLLLLTGPPSGWRELLKANSHNKNIISVQLQLEAVMLIIKLWSAHSLRGWLLQHMRETMWGRNVVKMGSSSLITPSKRKNSGLEHWSLSIFSPL